MAESKLLGFLLLVFFSTVLLSAIVVPGCRAHRTMLPHSVLAKRDQWLQWEFKGEGGNSRRLMIGSTRPACTYNECRGCRFRCTAEQVPVEGNNPIHSAYHYKCVCHRGEEGMGSDGDVSLNLLKTMMADFTRERDWDRFHSPRNLLLALVGEVGELSEIFQWKGEVPRGLPGWNDDEKVHLGDELSDVLLDLVRLSDICGVDLGKAVLRKARLNAIKYHVTATNDKNHEETSAAGTDALGGNDDGESIGRGGGC